MADRPKMVQRAFAGVSAFTSSCPSTNPNMLAAMGYCFGGLVVLDMARAANPHLRAVFSYHGILDRPDLPHKDVVAKVVVFHGIHDPFVSEENLREFGTEMEHRHADWQLYRYEAMHAFTRPEKTTEQDRKAGLYYNGEATRDSWLHTTRLLSCYLHTAGGP